jgi:5-methylcytosine-specific restriction enzyme A
MVMTMANNLNVDHIARVLTFRHGLGIYANSTNSPKGLIVEFYPIDVHANESFKIQIILGWRSVEAVFVPGKFAANLIRDMGDADKDQRAAFCALAGSILESNSTLNMRINGAPANPCESSAWPAAWSQLELRLRSQPMSTDTDLSQLDESACYTRDWAEKMLSLVITLLPLEEESDQGEEGIVQGRPEGASKRQEITKYERSRPNRSACIAIHGVQCQVCNLDFAIEYGSIGEGFINVHHTVPVSKLGDGYIINPAVDLIPVCPNCHAMLHRKDPPYTVEELQSIRRSLRGA